MLKLLLHEECMGIGKDEMLETSISIAPMFSLAWIKANCSFALDKL